MRTALCPCFILVSNAGTSTFSCAKTGRIEGVTPEGRATTRLLDFNAEERVQLRRLLMRQGWRP